MQAPKLSEGWKGWEGQVAGGSYCLRQYLGGCDASAVFLTEYSGRRAAIKLVRAEPAAAGEMVSRWERAARLSHPNLVRLFATGRMEQGVLYVVMEYAEEVLSQVLPQRTLTDEEVREMLEPVLSALEYLHGHGLAHGRIKPSNMMSVDGRLKLSSDWIGAGPAAADMRALGTTLIEALSASSPMLEIARLCREGRPVSTVRAALRGELPVRREEMPAHREEPVAPPPVRFAKKQYVVAAAACGAVLAVLLAAPRFFRHGQEGAPARPAAAAEKAPPAVERAPAAEKAPAAASGAVVSHVLPDVPQRALSTIRGKVRVAVRVQVDGAGAVSGASIESAGPSRYFAKLALDAARRWKFEPAPGEWVLRFTFERDGTQAAAARRN